VEAVDLSFIVPLAGLVHRRQRFGEHRDSFLRLPDGSVGVGEQAEEIRPPQRLSHRAKRRQSLAYLSDALVSPTLNGHRPPAEDRGPGQPLRESLLARQGHRRPGELFDGRRFSEQLVEHGSIR
jgi:hypothetical protein